MCWRSPPASSVTCPRPRRVRIGTAAVAAGCTARCAAGRCYLTASCITCCHWVWRPLPGSPGIASAQCTGRAGRAPGECPDAARGTATTGVRRGCLLVFSVPLRRWRSASNCSVASCRYRCWSCHMAGSLTGLALMSARLRTSASGQRGLSSRLLAARARCTVFHRQGARLRRGRDRGAGPGRFALRQVRVLSPRIAADDSPLGRLACIGGHGGGRQPVAGAVRLSAHRLRPGAVVAVRTGRRRAALPARIVAGHPFRHRLCGGASDAAHPPEPRLPDAAALQQAASIVACSPQSDATLAWSATSACCSVTRVRHS